MSEFCSVVDNLLLTIALYDFLNWLIFPFVSSNLYTGYICNTNRYFRYNCYPYYIFLLNKCQWVFLRHWILIFITESYHLIPFELHSSNDALDIFVEITRYKRLKVRIMLSGKVITFLLINHQERLKVVNTTERVCPLHVLLTIWQLTTLKWYLSQV